MHRASSRQNGGNPHRDRRHQIQTNVHVTIKSSGSIDIDGVNRQTLTVTNSEHPEDIIFLCPPLTQPRPRNGDRLVIDFGPRNPRTGLSEVTNFRFTRISHDVFLTIQYTRRDLDGNGIIFFNKETFGFMEDIPSGQSTLRFAHYRASMVETSLLAKYGCIWRAFNLEQVVSAKEGLFVTGELSLGLIEHESAGIGYVLIKNMTPEVPQLLLAISLVGCRFEREDGPISISLPYMEDETYNLKPTSNFRPELRLRETIAHGEWKMAVKVKGIQPGRYRFRILLRFQTGIRTVDVLADVAEPRRVNKLIPEFVDMSRMSAPRFGGPKTEKAHRQSQLPCFNKDWAIPPGLMAELKKETKFEDLCKLEPSLNRPLVASRYMEKLHHLLWFEEYHEMKELRAFDLVTDELRKVEGEKNVYRLRVLGLEEGRPSIIAGDYVDIWRASTYETEPDYRSRGLIIAVEQEHVVFETQSEFNKLYREHVLLRFGFFANRAQYRRLHSVVELAHWMRLTGRTLFPTLDNRRSAEQRVEEALRREDPIQFVNPKLNEHQKNAVRMIVHGKVHPMPHIIFGPPGTGKTVTVVETALQIFKCIPNSRMLICAPSNAGTDLITKRILESGVVKEKYVRRVVGFLRGNSAIPEELVDVCQVGCEMELSHDYRIILTTCQSAVSFIGMGMNFTHVIVDEAGFATEPETLIPICAAGGFLETQIILAGDPYQLGPQIRSPYAKAGGLGDSLLTRLLRPPVYCWYEDGAMLFCPHLVTMLDTSYRSVHSLVKISSHMFYSGTIKAAIADEENQIADMMGMMKKELTFWPSESPELRLPSSPSICNKGQASIVAKLLERLYGVGIEAHQVAILTPYRLQVKIVRDALARQEMVVPDVGTVDEFQGQEKDIIIYTTVRSRAAGAVTDDLQRAMIQKMGFLCSPERTNVALSRARFMLMIVGNPKVLCLEPYWKALLRYCALKGKWGSDLSKRMMECSPPEELELGQLRKKLKKEKRESRR